MKRYIIIDSDGWVSNNVYKNITDARRQATQLITMDGWKNTKSISVYEIVAGDKRGATEFLLPFCTLNRVEILKNEAAGVD